MKQVIIVKPSAEYLEKRDVFSWPVWEKNPSRFDWNYDSIEECLIIEGKATIETNEENYHLKPGDFVTFKSGLKCTWDIQSKIKKHYNFL